MFRRIAIANRGEIACRIIRACRKLGIGAVALYSEADARALHVRMADEAICIGPAPPAGSYLSIGHILEALEHCGADAVHPGYGFLSENEAFAGALAERGICFIGPPVTAIRAMGDKIAAKALAQEAGVPVVPGHIGEIRDVSHAAALAGEIGYPVMLKPSAGGGGKGMRVVRARAELGEALEAARREARFSFGDERILMEKYILSPRHVEIQVLGDRHGNIIFLGERECSIQRRHQKIIEEAPSPLLDPGTRQKMGEKAVGLARAAGYFSAGTVEFVVSPRREFYFMEMNTRLQVEHPVTELVTGVDMVVEMIRIAAGEHLTIRQEDVTLRGWAIEARVCAENPYSDFLPSAGVLRRWELPSGEGIRIDTGFDEGSTVPVYYDSMVAKVCAHDNTRAGAISRLERALDSFGIEGVSHNIPFLLAVLASPRFHRGDLSTDFITETFPAGFHNQELSEETWTLLAGVAVFCHLVRTGREMPSSSGTGELVVSHGETSWRVSCVPGETANEIRITSPGKTCSVRGVWSPGRLFFRGVAGDMPVAVAVTPSITGFGLRYRGHEAFFRVLPPHVDALFSHMPVRREQDASRHLLAPMPGTVSAIHVAPGDCFQAGDRLASIEAMKMENILHAQRSGCVATVHVENGQGVNAGDILLTFAAPEAAGDS